MAGQDGSEAPIVDAEAVVVAEALVDAEADISQLPKWAREHIETLKRSYLYLRISLVGVVLAIFAAILFVPAGYKTDGEFLLQSISHYYYTPARIVFTGALCAAALALIAISGPGVQSLLLDLAALLAPLIAIIPTRTLTSELGADAALGACVPGWIEKFKDNPDCIPEDQLDYALVGFGVWVCIAGLGLLVALLRGLRLRIKARWYWIVFGMGVVTLLVYAAWWWSPWSEIDYEALQRWGHFTAAGVFFVIIMVVAAMEAVWQLFGDHKGKPEPAFLARKYYALIYFVIAVAFIIDIVFAVVVLARDHTIPDGIAVLVIEAVGLLCFMLFWGVQTLEHCRDAEAWENPPHPREWTAARAFAA